jgi:SAM-dependent methyltransferase
MVPEDHPDYLQISKEYYDKKYSDYGSIELGRIVENVVNAASFLEDATQTDTSWVGLYYGSFRNKLQDATVLELGAGDGLNSLIMAALGAKHVTAVDISQEAGRLIGRAADALGVSHKVEVLVGDFQRMRFEPRSFDLIVGKAFLHHLTHQMEERYLRKASRLLCHAGEARFFEPATNSKMLCTLQFLIPVGGRPSCLNPRAFKAWKERSPEPPRDNSSEHYRRVCQKYFEEVVVIPIGGIERLHRLLPSGKFNRRFRRLAFRAERYLPFWLRTIIARSRTIILHKPRGA